MGDPGPCCLLFPAAGRTSGEGMGGEGQEVQKLRECTDVHPSQGTSGYTSGMRYCIGSGSVLPGALAGKRDWCLRAHHSRASSALWHFRMWRKSMHLGFC